MSARADADALAGSLGEGATVREAHGEVTLDVPRELIAEACAAALAAGYDFLVDLAATDYLGYAGDGVAGYWGSPTGAGARDLNLPASTGLAAVSRRPAASASRSPTSCSPAPPARPGGCGCAPGPTRARPCRASSAVFPCADYQEREAWDLMGVAFDGHPALERIFLPEGWDGHPHRKDYPIGGEPVQFSDEV